MNYSGGEYELSRDKIVYRNSRFAHPFSRPSVNVSIKRNAAGKFDLMTIDLETVSGNYYRGIFKPGSGGTVDVESVLVAKRKKGAEGFHYEFAPEHSIRMHENANSLKPLLTKKMQEIISHNGVHVDDFSKGMAKYLGL
jgi:hypothetical protein